MLLRLERDMRMPFLLGKTGATPVAPVNIYIENAPTLQLDMSSVVSQARRKIAFAFVA